MQKLIKKLREFAKERDICIEMETSPFFSVHKISYLIGIVQNSNIIQNPVAPQSGLCV